MTKIIGLTGGIGSGKTTIANYFQSLGIPVYIADTAAKKIIDEPLVQQQIQQAFGESVVIGNKVDREKLAAIVFSNPEQLAVLNSIVHPAVRNHFQQWLIAHQNEPIVIKETAILFESSSDKDCDAIITVTAPIETRIERVISRDRTTKEAVLQRVQNQWTDEMRISKSDYVIDNNDLSEAQTQANEILKKLLNP